MPDPLFHLCTALLPKAITGGRHVGPFAVGVMLPDLGSRVPSMGLERLLIAGLPVPDFAMQMWSVFHLPLGALSACLFLGFWFPMEQRRPVVGWLCAGVALHFAADILQFHHEAGYALGFPLSRWRFELGWIGSEATVPWAPAFAALTAVSWGARWFYNRRAAAT